MSIQIKLLKVQYLTPGSEVHLQGLAAVGEDVEGDLGPLALEVRDELLQDLDLVHLGADLGDLALVLQLLHQGAAVLDQSEVSTATLRQSQLTWTMSAVMGRKGSSSMCTMYSLWPVAGNKKKVKYYHHHHLHLL